MAIEVIMPQGGQDIEVGRVVRWLRSEGDQVEQGDVICEVETDKAVFEVEAPGSGKILKIAIAEGEEAAILSVIAFIGESGEGIPSLSPNTDKENGLGVFIPVVEAKKTEVKSEPAGLVVSPRAKRIADEMGVPLDKLSGSGPKGRIIEKDVVVYIDKHRQSIGQESDTGIEGGQIESLSKVRKVTARKMQQSKQTVPHFYASIVVDMTLAVQARAEYNRTLSNPEDAPVTVTDLMIFACARAFQASPELNCSILNEDKIVLWDDLNFGIAVDVNGELLVPVIEKVDLLSISDIARERKRLVAKAADGKITSLAPARFTISNMGGFNISQFTAIINPPESAILAISSIQKLPAALEDNSIGLRDMLNLTLSVDHRASDGIVACRFLNTVKDVLEKPATIFGL